MDCDSPLASTRFSYRFRLKFLLLGFLLLLLAPLSAWVRLKRISAVIHREIHGAGSHPQQRPFRHSEDHLCPCLRYPRPIQSRQKRVLSGGTDPRILSQVKKENPFTLFTNAGDDYEKAQLAEELSRGQSTREVVEAMQYDVRALGNHDFAWGLRNCCVSVTIHRHRTCHQYHDKPRICTILHLCGTGMDRFCHSDRRMRQDRFLRSAFQALE